MAKILLSPHTHIATVLPSLGLCLDVRGYCSRRFHVQSFGHVFQVLIKLYDQKLVFGEISFITARCYTRALRRDPQDAKGMTTDVYPRENCIAPDMCCIVYELVYEPGSPRTPEVEGRKMRAVRHNHKLQ